MSKVIYDKGGLRAELVDNEAVAIYVWGIKRVEMTRDEFLSVYDAILESEDEYV